MGRPLESEIVYRFGVFEVFAKARELYRRGHRVQLQDQPFEILLILLEHPGEIVSRDLLQQRLWPENTFVEFGQSLGTAVKKLRQALGDEADNPRFVETIPRRGYRFIAPVSSAPVAPADASPEALPPVQPQPSGEVHEPVPQKAAALSSRHRRSYWIYGSTAAAAVLLCGVFLAYSYYKRNAFALGPRDTVVVADFENTTGDPVFDDVLRQVLIVGVNQSPIVNVLSDRNTSLVSRQMGHAPNARINGRLAMELCKRVGGKVTVQGSISSIGTTYLIGLAAIRCDTGKPIAREQIEAAQKDDVVGALGKVTSQLRSRLGESLPSLQKYNAPLEQATTSSLDALMAYSDALTTWDRKGDLASIPFFQKAIHIDPNFAMAYGGLAAVYHNQGAVALARENTVAAYKLRDRVTEAERTSIDARYYLYVTKELDKAALAYQSILQDYPDSASSLNHLGTADDKLGHPERAVESFQRALALDPSRATTYANLSVALLQLNRVPEAISVLDKATQQGMHTDYLTETAYWLAFIRGQDDEMRRLVNQAPGVPGARSRLLSAQANTEAYNGHFQNARKVSYAAVDSMLHDGDRELAANCLERAALREAETGSAANARLLMQQAAKNNDDQQTDILAAVVAAEIGDDQRALSIADKLSEQFPLGTLIQKYWLPVIRAKVALRHGDPDKAIQLLAVAEPFDMVAPDEFRVTPLYPAYMRGQAYLAKKDRDKAMAEFRKLIDHPGMVLNSPLAPLARLGLARATALDPHSAAAATAYQDFFRMWKDADPGLPILRQAHAEFDRLSARP